METWGMYTKISDLLFSCLFFCVLFADFSDVFMFSVFMPLGRYLKDREFEEFEDYG